jgi:hypothetical protein
MPRKRHHMLRMQAALRQHDRDINRFPRHHVVHVRVCRHPELLTDRVGTTTDDIAYGSQLGTRDLLVAQQFGMTLRYATAANEGEAQGGHRFRVINSK